MNEKSKIWTEKEIAYLKKQVKKGLELEVISKEMNNRSQEAIRKKMKRLGLSLDDTNSMSARKWSEPELVRLAIYIESPVLK